MYICIINTHNGISHLLYALHSYYMFTGDGNSSDDDKDDDGLSTGAAVAISVVVTFVMTLVATSLISVVITRMYYKCRLNKTATTKNSEDASTQDNS